MQNRENPKNEKPEVRQVKFRVVILREKLDAAIKPLIAPLPTALGCTLNPF
jgi:hypothetical protein